jgi:hypothetical protein
MSDQSIDITGIFFSQCWEQHNVFYWSGAIKDTGVFPAQRAKATDGMLYHINLHNYVRAYLNFVIGKSNLLLIHIIFIIVDANYIYIHVHAW